MLSGSDDSAHEPLPDDPFSTETIWFGFSSEARKLGGATYVLMRPNLGVCSLGIWLWDNEARTDKTMLYHQNYWHLPLPADLNDIRLPVGYSERVIEPGRQYRVRYADGVELELDLTFEGIHAPVSRQAGRDTYPGSIQIGRVTGSVNLSSETVEVDSYEFRGRAWTTSRPEGRVARVPANHPEEARVYTDTFATTSPGEAFFVTTHGGINKTEVVAGYLMREGRIQPIAHGKRTITRNAQHGYPEQINLEAVDDLGREFNAVGTCVNRYTNETNSGFPNSISGVSWIVNGKSAWGQDQDCPMWLPGLTSD